MAPPRRLGPGKPQSLDDEVTMIVREARMVLPGIQALFGFQMIAFFNQRFETLASRLQSLHFGALCLCAIAMALVMSPAAYHRLAQRGFLTREFAAITSRCIALAMVALACSLSLEVFVVGALFGGAELAVWTAGPLLLLFIGLWLVWPLLSRHPRRH
ncbi:MAG: hypothetical protein JOZ67_01065 [Gammaproteobacteria bacterium]|nr:hypothetical protein [Gammaproteobacteria bacterium]MBV9698472.1 hypothetical protein [Gammaproteobacteria bacterium]